MNLTQALHRSLQQTPDRIATIFGDRVRTYTEQGERVARLAGALNGLGVSDGERVAILSLNSDRYAELLFAIPWANGVLNPVNIRWSAPEIVYSLVESDTAILFVDDAFAAAVPAIRDGHPGLTTVVHMGDDATPEGMLSYEALVDSSSPVEDAMRGGDEIAGLFYTGGTTGFPKGVMLTHANMLASALGSQATTQIVIPGGQLLHAAPMFHLADLAAWVMQSMVGGTHVIVPMFEPQAVLTAIQTHHVTNALLVPTMIQMLVDHPATPDHDLSSVRTVLYGASPITEALLERAMKTFPQADFVQAYGMTELSPIATILTGEDHRTGARLRSAGRAAAHAEVRIVDADDNEVPRGTVGEVTVRGGHVMRGYWNKQAETDEALRGGWMHTGDGAYMDDEGYIFIVDRIKDMIISGGENVYSAEVENAVAQHPAVAACAVIGVPDDEWGERVHAVVVLKPGATTTAEELREHAKTLIAGYKAPRTAEFVDALPVSGAGKVLKRELRARYWEEGDRGVH
ncbi:MAG TPA: long-chain fatty acid--CoA ligase [Acidimicrobiales bacterium]|nr:long-chain fatty acid--CoA ligase [Acidimicrobiales bacterium]